LIYQDRLQTAILETFSELTGCGVVSSVVQTPPIATPWKKIFDFGTSFDTLGNTAISADGVKNGHF
jgi:hypothetical protein